jgi:hypothetical protein
VSRRRIVPALVAAALATTVLAGCKSNVGVAARVGGTSISESDVNKYVDPKGAPSAAANQNASARSVILSVLVQEQVFEQILRQQGVRPSAGEVAAQHDAAGLVLNTQLTGSDLDRAIEQQVLAKLGIKRSLRPVFLRTYELEFLLVKHTNVQQFSELVAFVKKAHVHVSVAPRYGTWDATNLQVNGTSPLPSFVSAQPAAGGS